MSNGVDVANLVCSIVALLAGLIVMIAPRVAALVMEFSNRNWDAFKEHMGQKGPDATVAAVYKELAPQSHARPGDKDYGKNAISDIGGSLASHGMGHPSDNGMSFYGTATVGTLYTVYEILRDNATTIETLKKENIILVRAAS